MPSSMCTSSSSDGGGGGNVANASANAQSSARGTSCTLRALPPFELTNDEDVEEARSSSSVDERPMVVASEGRSVVVLSSSGAGFSAMGVVTSEPLGEGASEAAKSRAAATGNLSVSSLAACSSSRSVSLSAVKAENDAALAVRASPPSTLVAAAKDEVVDVGLGGKVVRRDGTAELVDVSGADDAMPACI